MAGLRTFVPADLPDEQPVSTAQRVVDTSGGELGRGFTSGLLGGVGATYNATLGALQEATGTDPRYSYARARDLLRRAGDSQPFVNNFDQVHSLGDFGHYAAGAIGNAAASYAPGLAVTALTRSPRLGLATMFPMEAGETIAQDRAGNGPHAPIEQLLPTAALKGGVNTALESVPFLNVFGRGPIAHGLRGTGLNFFERAGAHALGEGTTELAQEVVGQQAQNYLNPERDRSGDTVGLREAFLQGALGSAPFAATSAVTGHAHDIAEANPAPKPIPLDQLADALKSKGQTITENTGKSAQEIFDAMQGGGDKKMSRFLTGHVTASEDVDNPDSFLLNALGKDRLEKLPVPVKGIAGAIDDYLRGNNPLGEGRDADTRFQSAMIDLFGNRDTSLKVLEHYGKGVTDTAAIQDRQAQALEAVQTPAWVDAARQDTHAEDPTSAAMGVAKGDYDYHFASRAGRPFTNQMAATRGAGDFMRRTNATQRPERISLLKMAQEEGLDPYALASRLHDDVTAAQKDEVARASKDKVTDLARAKRVSEGNQVLKKLNLQVDLDTGERYFATPPEQSLARLFVLRAAKSADDQTAVPNEVRTLGVTQKDRDAALSFTKDGKTVDLSARKILQEQLMRSAQTDDNPLVDRMTHYRRSIESGVARLVAAGYQIKEIPDNTVVRRTKDGNITYGQLREATAQSTEVTPEQRAEELAAEERANARIDSPEGPLTPTELPETLREQDAPGPRTHEESLVGDVQSLDQTVRDRRADRPEHALPAPPVVEGSQATGSDMERVHALDEFRRELDAHRQLTTEMNQKIDARMQELLAPRTANIEGKKKLSEANRQNFVPEPDLTQAEQDALKAEIVHQRGPEVAVEFRRAFDLGGAGSFEKTPHGQRIIQVALDVGLAPAQMTAHHEALHDFFGTLLDAGTPQLRSAWNAIDKAAQSPAVQRQLKQLLANHPAALEQLHDSEEAAAYMYQFWAAGLLKIAPAPANWLEKVAAFIRGVAGILTRDEKAQALLGALKTGKFAQRSTVGAVLNDMKAETLQDKAQRLLGPIYHTARAVMASTTDRLNETNVPALQDLARLFNTETDKEGGRLAFLQKRAMNHGKWIARLNQILAGTTSEERAAALEMLQGRVNTQDALTGKVRTYLDEMFNYLRKSGVAERISTPVQNRDGSWRQVESMVPIRAVQDNYFPRRWNRDAIEKDKQAFTNLIAQHGQMNAAKAANIVEQMLGDDQVELADGVTYTPYFQSAAAIKLSFINKANAPVFAPYQDKDLVGIMSMYTYQATHRAEYTRFFDNRGEVIDDLLAKAQAQGATADEIDTAKRAVAALTGTLGHDMNPKLRKFMSNVLAYENVVLLPLSLLNNLMDVVGVGVRANDIKESWNAFKEGMSGLKKALLREGPDANRQMAELLGLIDDNTTLANYGVAYDGSYITGFAKRVNDKFFRWNGMMTWNQHMRVASMLAAQRFVTTHAERANAGDEQSARFLKELNLSAQDVQLKPDGTPKVLVADGLSSEQATKMQEAIFRFVDGAALRPSAAHRPIWGSDPRYMLIFHLKQFTFSFQKVTLRYVGKEVENGNMVPLYTLLAYAPFTLATNWTRALLLGKPINSSLSGILAAASHNSALAGTGSFTGDALTDASKGSVPGMSFLGPSAGHALQALQTLAGNPQDSFHKLLLRSVPFSPVAKAAIG